MNLAEAIGYIDQAREIRTLRLLSLTGGEPFLLLELLCKIASYAKDSGLETEVVTNCYWAEKTIETKAILAKLAHSGVSIINMSVDDFHQEFIPFGNIVNCYEAARELGLKVTLQCTFSSNSKLRLAGIIELLGKKNILVLGKSPVDSSIGRVCAIGFESPFVPAGRGTGMRIKQWIMITDLPRGGCQHVLRDIAIDPSGFVLPCCSAACVVGSARLGNARETPLKELIEKANTSEVFQTLASQGPQALLSEESHPGSSQYTGRCHMCYEALLKLEGQRRQVFTGKPYELK